jgi:hypothetical protein
MYYHNCLLDGLAHVLPGKYKYPHAASVPQNLDVSYWHECPVFLFLYGAQLFAIFKSKSA